MFRCARTFAALSTATVLGVAGCAAGPSSTGAAPALSRSAASATPTASAPPSQPSSTTTPAPRPTGVMAKQRAKLPPGWSDLGNATLDVPSWGTVDDAACPHGPVTLVNGWFPPPLGSFPIGGIGETLAVDLDGDGAREAVVRLDCLTGDPATSQVVGFARVTGGGIATMGVVVGPADGGPDRMSDLAADGDRVRMTVNDVEGSAGAAVEAQVYQTRAYGWDGSAFHQTSGSTSFTTAAKVSGRGGDMKFAPPSGGKLIGTMSVTLRNDGTTRVGSITLVGVVGYTPLLPMDGPGCRRVNDALESCRVGDLAPGQSRTVSLRFDLPEAATGALEQVDFADGFLVRIMVGDQKTLTDPLFGKVIFP
jgi:hypothetical protein